MTSDWIQHVIAYKNRKNISYKQALKEAKASYKGGSLKGKMVEEVDHLLKTTTEDKAKQNLQKQKEQLEKLEDTLEGGDINNVRQDEMYAKAAKFAYNKDKALIPQGFEYLQIPAQISLDI